MLSHLAKCLRTLAATNALVVFYYSLGETGLSELDIANNSETRQLMSDVVDLPAPISVLELCHERC